MKHLLKSALAALGYRVQGIRYCPRQLLEPACLRAIEFDDVVCRHMVEANSEFIFIQIGAFDGTTGDPLRKYIEQFGWRGVMVEPQSHAAGKLRDLYCHNDRLIILQAALDRDFGSRRLFTVKSQTAPAWAGGLASFKRETISKHSDLIPGLEATITEETVDCITFDKILSYLPNGRLDLLQIDTEGTDGHVLSLFPFERVQPAIIHWEVKHLKKQEREDCFEKLARFGYRFASSGDEDMMAVLDPCRGTGEPK